MNEDKHMLLDVRHLSVGFESYNARLERATFQAIADLSVTLSAGDILAVVGSSGSGKSLLAHAVMGILPGNARTGGEMFYRGEAMTAETKARLRGREIAFIPQSVAFLDPLMRVDSQVCGVSGKGQYAKMREAFAHFGLKPGVEKLYPFQLSGGMARRVLLSTAYVADAELIIADEPTPGLDLEIALEALKDFRVMADHGKAVLLITHDIDLALRVADTISIFYDGRVVETAAVSSFSGDGEGLKHPYSRALFRALPQNGFHLDRCSRCGSSSATWVVDEREMRCGCHA